MNEKNILIADFIGWKLCNCGIGNPHYKYGQLNWQTIEIQNMNFDKNWNSLMPVVKKCIDSYGDNKQDIFDALHKVDIIKLFNACVEFIQSYNSNVKTKKLIEDDVIKSACICKTDKKYQENFAGEHCLYCAEIIKQTVC